MSVGSAHRGDGPAEDVRDEDVRDEDAAADAFRRLGDAASAAWIFALDPAAVGGLHIVARAGPARALYLDLLRWARSPARAAAASPWLTAPAGAPDDRLIGGLDLAATLATGAPVLEPGVLARADGGVLAAPMAERLQTEAAARIAAAMDDGAVRIERDGLSAVAPSRFGLLLLDEAAEPDEAAPARLVDRCGLSVDLTGLRDADLAAAMGRPPDFADARARLAALGPDDAARDALVSAAAALGIASLRAPTLALAVARAAAAVAGRTALDPDDLALAAALAHAPHAKRFTADPADAPDAPDAPEPPAPPDPDAAPEPPEGEAVDAAPPEDVVLAAALAALPPDLLARLAARAAPPAGSAGASGAERKGGRRGRLLPPRPGRLGGDARLDVVATLRAAAPWRRLRAAARAAAGQPPRRTELRPEDFRLRRRESRSETLLIFAVDASGSSAARRLGEAKGAVELLLAESYQRRDHVALIAFRKSGAAVILPPTRALARAKRALAGLAGGGPTPLAAGLDAAADLAASARRAGRAPTLILLTDGQANVRRDGGGGRGEAMADALASARRIAADGTQSIVLDTSLRPRREAADLATALRARYEPLPRADAAAVSATVADAARGPRRL